jgi:hypothetical protein
MGTDGRHLSAFEIVCVIVVVLAFAALVAGLVLHSGGGVLNQG